jgi:hypothetical protein
VAGTAVDVKAEVALLDELMSSVSSGAWPDILRSVRASDA